MIARFTIFDDRKHLHARAVDVGIPDHWDTDRVIAEAPRLLPHGVALIDTGLRVTFFPDDDDGGLFADWRGVPTVQGSLFESLQCALTT